MESVRRRLAHYHFHIQLILLIVGLVGCLLPSVIPWISNRTYYWVCAVLIIQFGLKRRVMPPGEARGFPVLMPWEKPN